MNGAVSWKSPIVSNLKEAFTGEERDEAVLEKIDRRLGVRAAGGRGWHCPSAAGHSAAGQVRGPARPGQPGDGDAPLAAGSLCAGARGVRGEGGAGERPRGPDPAADSLRR